MSEGTISVRRMSDSPIIRPFAERRMGGNVCGPSLIRTPDWLPCALGRYHLYFAHHLGSYIRLAYADRLEGPWAIHAPGVLDIAQTPLLREHIASPDVHVDEDRRELRMYFHGVASPDPWAMPDQRSCVAHSFDGITFAARPAILGESYFRAWPHEGVWFALSLAGRLWRSPDGLTPFEEGPRPAGLPETARHLAVLRKGARLWVAWTEIGAAPEAVMLGWIDLSADWAAWRLEGAREILRPEADWEGAGLPLEASAPGLLWKPARQLRDPCFFSEDGADYLLYAAAGESGIGLARIDGLTEGTAP